MSRQTTPPPTRRRLIIDTQAMGQLQDRINVIEEILAGLHFTFVGSDGAFQERFPTTFNDANVWDDITGDPVLPVNPVA